jgi:hypothetical protein
MNSQQDLSWNLEQQLLDFQQEYSQDFQEEGILDFQQEFTLDFQQESTLGSQEEASLDSQPELAMDFGQENSIMGSSSSIATATAGVAAAPPQIRVMPVLIPVRGILPAIASKRHLKQVTREAGKKEELLLLRLEGAVPDQQLWEHDAKVDAVLQTELGSRVAAYSLDPATVQGAHLDYFQPDTLDKAQVCCQTWAIWKGQHVGPPDALTTGYLFGSGCSILEIQSLLQEVLKGLPKEKAPLKREAMVNEDGSRVKRTRMSKKAKEAAAIAEAAAAAEAAAPVTEQAATAVPVVVITEAAETARSPTMVTEQEQSMPEWSLPEVDVLEPRVQDSDFQDIDALLQEFLADPGSEIQQPVQNGMPPVWETYEEGMEWLMQYIQTCP